VVSDAMINRLSWKGGLAKRCGARRISSASVSESVIFDHSRYNSLQLRYIVLGDSPYDFKVYSKIVMYQYVSECC
jgi:hypothetical protein